MKTKGGILAMAAVLIVLSFVAGKWWNGTKEVATTKIVPVATKKTADKTARVTKIQQFKAEEQVATNGQPTGTLSFNFNFNKFGGEK